MSKKTLKKENRLMRNKEMMELIKEGYKQKVIAEKYGISHEHLSRIKKKYYEEKEKK